MSGAPAWMAPHMRELQRRAVMMEGHTRQEAERILIKMGIERGTRTPDGQIREESR